MYEPLLVTLANTAEELNSARRIRNHGRIAKRYEQIASILRGLYRTGDAATVLEIERTLIAGEQNA